MTVECRYYCIASYCPEWAPCHPKRAEGLPDGQSESAATDTAPQPTDDPNVAKSSVEKTSE